MRQEAAEAKQREEARQRQEAAEQARLVAAFDANQPTAMWASSADLAAQRQDLAEREAIGRGVTLGERQ